MSWRIKTLTTGVLNNIDREANLFGLGEKGNMKLPLLAYLIVNNESNEKIIVDTGGPSEQFARKYHPKSDFTQPVEQRIENALLRENCNLDDIDLIILTHLHWDHVANVNLFSSAKIIVQRDEVMYALSPLPVHRLAYENTDEIKPGWFASMERIDVVDGDIDILPGISVVKLPGHSPGSQGVLVTGNTTKYLIAGDTIPIYENWEGVKGFNHIPNVIHHSLVDFYSSFSKIEKLNATIIPSHDIRICDKVFI